MTDIPVGSPPVPPGRHAAPGGWYPDPLDGQKERYWDGWQWSKNTRVTDTPAAGPSAGGPGGQPYPGQLPPGQAPQSPYATGQPPQSPQGQAYPQGQSHPQGQQYPQGPSYPQQYPQGQPYGPPGQPYQPYGQDQFPQGQYPQGQYSPGPYPQGQYPQGQYQQGQYPVNIPGQRAVATADGVPLAGWWQRALAVLIDWILVSLLVVIPGFGIYSRLLGQMRIFINDTVTAAQSGQAAPPTPSPTDLISAGDQLALTLVTLIVGLLYNALFLRWKAATPGKLALRLRVVPVDQGNFQGQLPWSSILIRVVLWVGARVQALLVIFRLVDVLFPLWHPKRQALHDLAAKTQVVKRR